jgi:hypothetical protein
LIAGFTNPPRSISFQLNGIHLAAYRLRVLRVNDLPVHATPDGRSFEFQLGVTLFDEALGTFYGNTVS